MTNHFYNSLPKLSRNPIGIIALFIALIYAIAALVLSFGSQLDANHRLILIIFLVIFPFIVLFTFYKLVTKHHIKLYAPVDYRSDESFLNTLDPTDVGKKVEDEIEESFGKVAPSNIKSKDKNESQNNFQVGIEKIKLIEDLVLREMESKFNTAFRRQAGIRVGSGNNIRFDAIGTAGNRYVAIEIKYIREERIPIQIIERIIKQANEVSQVLNEAGKEFQLVIAIVTDLSLENYTDLKIEFNDLKAKAETSVNFAMINFSQLKEKYGIK